MLGGWVAAWLGGCGACLQRLRDSMLWELQQSFYGQLSGKVRAVVVVVVMVVCVMLHSCHIHMACRLVRGRAAVC